MGRTGAVVAACLWGGAALGWGGVRCRELKGSVTTEQTTVGCTSPLGLCFAGTLKTNSSLHGATYFVVTQVAAVPGTTLIAFSGVFTVTERSGQVVTFQSTGTADTATDTFVESFTGTVAGETVVLTATGTTNAALSAFTGEVTGSICG